jgi:hypothetical protein
MRLTKLSLLVTLVLLPLACMVEDPGMEEEPLPSGLDGEVRSPTP